MTELIVNPGTEIKKPELIQPGWYKNMSNEQYHGSNGSSSSNLKTLLEGTGAHYQYNKEFHENEDTAAKALGTAFHTLTLEPEKFDEDIAVRPKEIKQRRGKDWEAFLLEAGNRTIITEEQFEKAKRMAESVRTHPTTGHLVRNIVVESSVYWWYQQEYDFREDHFSELLKCRPDALHKEWPWCIDLKSVRSGTFTDFMRAIHNYYYHVSGAMYLEGCNQNQELLNELGHIAITDFIFVIVESEPPFLPRAIRLSPKDRQRGLDLYHRAARKLNQTRQENWPGFTMDIVDTELPRYADYNHIVD